MDETAIHMHRHAKNSDFSIDFAIFAMWLQTYGWMDGQNYGWTDGQTDGQNG